MRQNLIRNYKFLCFYFLVVINVFTDLKNMGDQAIILKVTLTQTFRQEHKI